jgi:hypothetical protein
MEETTGSVEQANTLKTDFTIYFRGDAKDYEYDDSSCDDNEKVFVLSLKKHNAMLNSIMLYY